MACKHRAPSATMATWNGEVVVGWLGRVSTILHCTHHLPTFRLSDASASFLLSFCHLAFALAFESFGDCRGRSSSPLWDCADRHLGSPSFRACGYPSTHASTWSLLVGRCPERWILFSCSSYLKRNGFNGKRQTSPMHCIWWTRKPVRFHHRASAVRQRQ